MKTSDTSGQRKVCRLLLKTGSVLLLYLLLLLSAPAAGIRRTENPVIEDNHDLFGESLLEFDYDQLPEIVITRSGRNEYLQRCPINIPLDCQFYFRSDLIRIYCCSTDPSAPEKIILCGIPARASPASVIP